MAGGWVIALDIGDAPKRPLPQAEVRFVHGSLSPGDRVGARSLIQKNRPAMPSDLNESSPNPGAAWDIPRSQALPGNALLLRLRLARQSLSGSALPGRAGRAWEPVVPPCGGAYKE